MTSKISMFAANISSSLLGKTQSYSLTNKTSNVYKSASIANTVLDYSKFGTTWIENKNTILDKIVYFPFIRFFNNILKQFLYELK